MMRTRQGWVWAVALLSVCGCPIAAKSEARPSARFIADGGMKKTLGLTGRSIQGADKFPVDGEFQSAPKLFRQGRYAEAERQFAWIARVRKETSWGERAQYYLAECQYQQKNYVGALASYERLHADYPATEQLDRLVSREYDIARFWLAQSDPSLPAERKLPWTARLDGRLPLFDVRGAALRALEHVEHNNPEGPLADDASIQIADDYMQRHEYKTAAAYYGQFLGFYGPLTSPFRWRAWLGVIEARIRSNLDPPWDAAVDGARTVIEPILRILSNLGDQGKRDAD
jgi:tetratricopeptide (TPR) repeat protein